METKYLSIITNFGCHYKCPYCVVKTNGINVPKTTIKGLELLPDAVAFTRANIISVSGGGDPLYEYPRNKAYYKKLFKLCKEMDIPLEMHTSYTNMKKFPYDKCRRVVYHLRSVEQLREVKRRGNEIVRVVFVVTEKFNRDLIFEIAASVSFNKNIDELTFRQMIDKDYRPMNYCEDTLEERHGDLWYYVKQGDYNPYYVNGDIYYRFSDIGTVAEVE